MYVFTITCPCGYSNVQIKLKSELYHLQVVCSKCSELLLYKKATENVAKTIESENNFKPSEVKHREDDKKEKKPSSHNFGQYSVERKIGEGGMAAVYLAVDQENQEKVALKVFKKFDDKNSLQYIIREAKILFKLKHHNIVSFRNAGKYKNYPFIAMEYIDGKSLEELTAQGPLKPKDALQVMLHVVEALIYASQFQLVHRDIKPANILISKQGVVKLIDLGVGKIIEDSGALTQTGDVIGTFFYMPNEQLRDSKNIDFSVDIYSTGATLYHLISGIPPYSEYGDNINKLLFAKVGARYIRLPERDPQLPQIIIDGVEKAMGHKPTNRYQTLFEMKKEWMQIYQQL